ncbi:MAG: restriction endonuclease subunit S [Chitinophagaceae bacterium]|nr:restriction endonuclease subunit S [Chitinophagaceae bacterium]
MVFEEFVPLNKLLQKNKSITYGIVQPGDYNENGIVMIRSQDYSAGWGKISNLFKVSEEIDRPYIRSRVNKGDILITVVGANIGKIAVVPDELDCSNISRSVARISIDSTKANSEFVRYFLENRIERLLYVYKVGGAQPVLNLDDLQQFKIPLPPHSEQHAIAQVLSTADAAIHTTEKLIAQKELRKKWLMQQLLTGRKRLKGFSGEIKPKVVGKFIKEISERNKDLNVSRVLSVTNSRGFINQSDQFDRSVASEDATNYKIVRKGQFAYNPSRVNVGSLDLLRNFDEGILSPMYVVFSTDEKHLLADFLYFHLKTQWFYGHIPMFVQGSVRDSLSFDGLCSMKFIIPTIEEQTAIAKVLQMADKEISLLKAKAEKLREMKKGLMQQLLTGKVRLKIN